MADYSSVGCWFMSQTALSTRVQAHRGHTWDSVCIRFRKRPLLGVPGEVKWCLLWGGTWRSAWEWTLAGRRGAPSPDLGAGVSSETMTGTVGSSGHAPVPRFTRTDVGTKAVIFHPHEKVRRAPFQDRGNQICGHKRRHLLLSHPPSTQTPRFLPVRATACRVHLVSPRVPPRRDLPHCRAWSHLGFSNASSTLQRGPTGCCLSPPHTNQRVHRVPGLPLASARGPPKLTGPIAAFRTPQGIREPPPAGDAKALATRAQTEGRKSPDNAGRHQRRARPPRGGLCTGAPQRVPWTALKEALGFVL